MMNTLLLKPLKKTGATVLEAVIKSKTFDPFSGLVLYKDDELLCPRFCLSLAQPIGGANIRQQDSTGNR